MSSISRKILFVDDDAMLLEGLRRRYRKTFELVTVAGGEAGLAALKVQGPFAVVVCDFRMPGMDGVEFLRQVHALRPETVLVMLTGQAELGVAVAALHEGHISRFLTKPCEPELMEAALRDCLEQYRLVMSERILRRDLDEANGELRLLNRELERLVAQRTAAIEGLYRLVSDLNGQDSLADVSRAIVSHTAEMLHSRQTLLLLPDGPQEYLVAGAAVGLDVAGKDAPRMAVKSAVAVMVFGAAQCLVANRIQELDGLDELCGPQRRLNPPLVLAPLLTSDGPAGMLVVADPVEAGGYQPGAMVALKAIGEAAGIALLIQIRRQERDDARDATILALAKLAEHRDPETGAHLERVQCYCRLVSESMARTSRYAAVITREFIETIVRSCPLHDVGKVGIPDRILLKPGKLDPGEFEIMKTHAKIGGDTIRALVEQGRRQSFLQMGMEIAYNHHERYDGTGYPQGLAGAAIPLPARVLALADVYDALTSRRVYKPPMSHGQASAIILAGRGLHFDPDVVAAFVEQAAEFERLALALAEPTPPMVEDVEVGLRA